MSIVPDKRFARTIVPDHKNKGAYQILLVLQSDCDLEVAQALADREQQTVLVYQKPKADPGDFDKYYEVSKVYPSGE